LRSFLFLVFASACTAPKPPTVEPRNAVFRGREYLYCAAEASRLGIDVEHENAAAFAEATTLAFKHEMPFDALLVPGYTPLDLKEPQPGVHPIGKERLLRAVRDYERDVAPFIVLSGGNVHPENTPYNEAIEMKRFLTDGGFPASRIFVEPCARHSHTNLRNSARLMLSAGLLRGLIVTSYDQAYYMANGRMSTFKSRQRNDFGFITGRLSTWDPQHVAFVPAAASFTRGQDPLDP
jgi:DUF218 domain